MLAYAACEAILNLPVVICLQIGDSILQFVRKVIIFSSKEQINRLRNRVCVPFPTVSFLKSICYLVAGLGVTI